MDAFTVAHWGQGIGFWPIFPVFWALFWIAAITFVIVAKRKGRWGHPAAARESDPTASAERILAERFARGEMTDDEYFAGISVLKGTAQ